MTATRTHRLGIAAALTFAGAVLTSAPLGAQTRPSAASGDYLFRTYCASCHGTSARGDGPLADSMRTRPADLTEIAKRNKGVFPREQVFRIIDGRQPMKGHGGNDMPVWGDVFAALVPGARRGRDHRPNRGAGPPSGGAAGAHRELIAAR